MRTQAQLEAFERSVKRAGKAGGRAKQEKARQACVRITLPESPWDRRERLEKEDQT